MAEAAETWQAHPEEDGAEILVVEGYWHTVLPGHWLRVVIVRRPQKQVTRQKKELEAFFTSLLVLDKEAILAEYRGRWRSSSARRESTMGWGRIAAAATRAS